MGVMTSAAIVALIFLVPIAMEDKQDKQGN